MSTTEDRLRWAIQAAADTVAPGSAPPLRLPSRPDRRLGRTGRPRRYGGWSRWITPLAAAAAVAAVAVASIAIGGLAHGPGGAQVSLSSVPPYYLALVSGNGNPAAAQYAVIRNTVTGATAATIRPPRPFNTFSQATGAADDRTFVLAAQGLPAGWRGPAGGKPPAKFFAVHFSPAGGTFTMTPLAIPEIGNFLDAIALSPDATRLAISSYADRAGSEDQVRVYSLASGAVRVWRAAGSISNGGGNDPNAMSWAADGRTLAFNWNPASYTRKGEWCFASAPGIWLLNTATAGGSLLADSRVAASIPVPGGLGWDGEAIVTPDATKVIVPVQWPRQTLPSRCIRLISPQPGSPQPGSSQPGTFPARPVKNFGFEVFSTRTGKPVSTLHPVRVPPRGGEPNLAVVWSNPSGSVLVVQAPTASGRPGVYGVLSGDKFTPIPGAPAVTGSDPSLVF